MYRNEHLDDEEWILSINWGDNVPRKQEFHLDDPTLLILQDEVDHIKGKSVLTKLSIQKRAPFLITKKAQMEKLWTVLISPMIGNTKLGKEMSA